MITDETIQLSFTADGSNRYWEYTFPILNSGDIEISVTDLSGGVTVLTENYYVDTYYNRVVYPTVESLLDPLPAGYTVTLTRIVSITQELDLVNNGRFSSADIESSLDKLTMICQQLQASSSAVIPLGDPTVNGSWRIVVSGTTLSVQRRESDDWVEKGNFS